ncbi:hypothetical protein JCM3766R1_004084 [Sporobolomyces carnicolor]
MAPIEVAQRLPDFHLHALHLGGPGSQAFFDHAKPYAMLKESTERVVQSLYPKALKDAEPPSVRSVTLRLIEEDGVAFTRSSEIDKDHKEIMLSTLYLEKVFESSGRNAERLRREIEGVLTHELVHVFQYDGRGTVPGGVVEGVADWVRNEHGLNPPHWSERMPAADQKWDTGYETTAFFLRWLSQRFRGSLLVPSLNLAMRRQTWDEGRHLGQLLEGHNVEDLWEEYKKSFIHGQSPAPEISPPVPTHLPGYRPGYT